MEGLDARLVPLGLMLVFVGLVLVVMGVLVEALKSGGKVEGGAVIVVGPIPIVLGSSPGAAKALMLLGLILTIAAGLLYYLVGRAQ